MLDMNFNKEFLRLYAVTDRAWTGTLSLKEQIEQALKGGVTCVQLREKELSLTEFAKEAAEIQALCRRYNTPFLINDNVELAVACNADGVHVGQSDMAAGAVRKKIGREKILGVSVQTLQQAIAAQQQGADYLGVGAVFTTATKLDADFVSLTTLQEICRTVTIPVVAIGGINRSNLLQLSETGIEGVALVSAIFASTNITQECGELLGLVKQAVGK